MRGVRGHRACGYVWGFRSTEGRVFAFACVRMCYAVGFIYLLPIHVCRFISAIYSELEYFNYYVVASCLACVYLSAGVHYTLHTRCNIHREGEEGSWLRVLAVSIYTHTHVASINIYTYTYTCMRLCIYMHIDINGRRRLRCARFVF